MGALPEPGDGDIPERHPSEGVNVSNGPVFALMTHDPLARLFQYFHLDHLVADHRECSKKPGTQTVQNTLDLFGEPFPKIVEQRGLGRERHETGPRYRGIEDQYKSRNAMADLSNGRFSLGRLEYVL